MNVDLFILGAGDEEILFKFRIKFFFCYEDDIVVVKCIEVGLCDIFYIF